MLDFWSSKGFKFPFISMLCFRKLDCPLKRMSSLIPANLLSVSTSRPHYTKLPTDTWFYRENWGRHGNLKRIRQWSNLPNNCCCLRFRTPFFLCGENCDFMSKYLRTTTQHSQLVRLAFAARRVFTDFDSYLNISWGVKLTQSYSFLDTLDTIAYWAIVSIHYELREWN